MTERSISFNLKGVTGEDRTKALNFAKCLIGSGNLVGTINEYLIRSPKSYSESFMGGCIVDEMVIPLMFIKVCPFTALKYNLGDMFLVADDQETDINNLLVSKVSEYSNYKYVVNEEYLPTGVSIVVV